MEQHLTSIAGVRMPPLIYGTAWKQERTAELVEHAVRAGFRGIDTACQPKHYHEAGVGEALKRLFAEGFDRDALYIQTKFTPLEGHDPKRIPYDPAASLAEQIAYSFDVSRRNLGCEIVDSLLLHSPLFPFSRLETGWRAMEALVREGKLRQIGISNCYDLGWLQRLYEIAEIKPAVVQNRFYADTGYDIALRQWCRERGIIYQSFWTLTANPMLLDSQTMRTIAKTRGIRVEQLLFAYLHRSGIVPLTGTTSAEHMAIDLASFTTELSAEESESISALLC
jgi:diketogulonate reductase-like aldo/keto reductase